MSPRVFFRDDVQYYLIKRKPKRGKAIYHARIFDKALDADGRRKIKAQKSTGATNEALAHKIVAQWLEEGLFDRQPESLRKYLLDFWNPDKSDYLKNKMRQGNTYSRSYLESSESAVRRLFLPYFEERGVTDLSQLDADNLEQWMQHRYRRIAW